MLQKQAVSVNFGKGLDTKTDPWQLELGNFLLLENSIFTTGNELKKRNGFGELTSITNSNATYLTTFGGNLTAIGTSLLAYSSGSNIFNSKGNLQPISLSTLPSVRSALNQIQCDTVIASNGVACTVYTEVNNGVSSYKYLIQDSITGQNLVLPTVIPVGSGAISGSPRVFLLGGYFVIVFTNLISSTYHLQYIAISVSTLSITHTNFDVASSYIPSSTVAWDGVVLGNQLFIAYNTTAGGQAVKITYLTPSGFGSASPTPISFTGSIATMMSMCVDNTNPAQPRIYAAFYDSASSTGYAVAINNTLNTKMTATEIISSGAVYNITCTAQSGIVTIAYEVANYYGYDSSLPSNYLNSVSVTLPATVTTGTVGSTVNFIRSVGLASKAFLMNSKMYMLGEYASQFQPTYFLFDINGNIISRFAYENGGASLNPNNGYLPLGLPQAQINGTTASIAYLYKDLIETTNTTPQSNGSGVIAPNNIYSQTGVNLVFLDFSSATLDTSEIGGNLNITGGFLWNYDGQTVNEQNFHVWPDNIELVNPADPTPTGTVSNITNPTIITAVSSVLNIVPGMNISGTGIPANTIVVSVGTNTVTMSNAATAAHSGETITFTGNVAAQQYYYQVTYEWTDAAGNIIRSAPSIPVTITPTSGHSTVDIYIPTLRLTYKTNVKIQIYRWSIANQIYYQITSLTAPTLNNEAVDFITYTDIVADDTITGNNILYTTGGLLENIAAPAAIATTLFDDRLWLIDAEDQNLLWFSKQVIEATPVETSDLLTFYVAPSIGSQGSTGTLTCLAPMDDKIILFKKDAIYYINGTGPDNTGANNNYSSVVFITSSVGSANQNSIVLIPSGLMFQSDKGIWLLGRDLSTQYIGAAVEAFNEYNVTSATSIPGTTQVRFTLSNGVILMYDYFYEQWGTFVGSSATSSTLYQSLHTLLNDEGVVSQETPGIYLDNGNPVLLSFLTSWLNLTGLQGYQRAFFFYLLGQYLTPFKLNLNIAYDYNSSPTQSTLISPTNFSPTYGNPSPYGQGNPYGGPSNVFNRRIFLAQQRCSAFQIALQEVYDPSFGVASGAGLTLSGINLVIGAKKGFRTISNAQSSGGGVNRG